MWKKQGKTKTNYQNSKIWSRFHLTCEIALSDEYLSQFFSDRKVLWMTLEQLFEIFMTFSMFDGMGAIFTYLHGASLTLGLFWVSKLKQF